MMMMIPTVIFYLLCTYYVSNLCLTLYLYYLIYSLQQTMKWDGLHLIDELAQRIYSDLRKIAQIAAELCFECTWY